MTEAAVASPLTLNIEKIIESLEPNNVLDEFDKIICFLYSESSELIFVNILKNVESLLVYIVTELNILKSEQLKVFSGGISELLYNVLDLNKNIFEIVYEHEYSRFNNKILIYKKSYFNRPNSGQMQILSKRAVTTPVGQHVEHNKYLFERHKLLTKMPKEIRKTMMKTEDFQKYLIERLPPAEETQRQSELMSQFRDTSRHIKYKFDDLPMVFKKASLQTIFDFVEDDSRCSLVFEAKSARELRFLIYVVNNPNKLVRFLQNDMKSLLMKLTAAVDKYGDFKLSSTQGKMDRRTKLSDLKIMKVPSNGSGKCLSVAETVALAASTPGDSTDCEQARDRSLSTDRRSREQSAGSECGRARRMRPPAADLNTRTKKLLADMSTPLKSDKAMKMMMSMGWDGGALGLRGEGITEPIMPALGMKQGAGLGHSPSQMSTPTKTPAISKTPELSKTPDICKTPDIYKTSEISKALDMSNTPITPSNNYRMAIIKHILEFVRSELIEHTIDCGDTLSYKQTKFWKAVLFQANGRHGNGFVGEIMECMKQLMKEMKRQPDMQVDVDFSQDMRNAKLTKSEICPKGVAKTKRKVERLIKKTPTFGVALNNFLAHMLEFVKTDRPATHITLPLIPSKTHVQVFQNWVTSVNTHTDSCLLYIYKSVCQEIMQCDNDCYLHLTLDGLSSFTLKKIPVEKSTPPQYQPKFTNSALSVALKDASGNTDASAAMTCSWYVNGDKVMDSDGDKSEDISEDKNVMQSSDVDSLPDEMDNVIRKTQNCDIGNQNTDGNNSDPRSKMETESISNVYFKTITIAPKSYPKEIITRAQSKRIQDCISETIDKRNVLPLLNCHGVQNGALVYGCLDVTSYIFLKEIVYASNDLTIIDEIIGEENETFKIAMKINCFSENVDNLFDRLQMYNPGLSTKDWAVFKKEVSSDFIIMTVIVDRDSYNYICKAHFSLYAGIDKAKFTLVWD